MSHDRHEKYWLIVVFAHNSIYKLQCTVSILYLAFIACYSRIDIPPSKWSEQIRSWLLGSQWPLGSTDYFHPKTKRWLVSGPWFRKSVIWPLQPVNFVIPFFDWNIWDTADILQYLVLTNIFGSAFWSEQLTYVVEAWPFTKELRQMELHCE